MFSHILLPIALNDREHSAISIAINLAETSKAKLTLLHVIEVIEGASFEEFADFYKSLDNKCREQIQEIEQKALDAGVSCSADVVFGHRVRDIVAEAQKKNIDLIVMQSHKVSPGDDPRGLNTISYQVGLLSQSAILLVK